MVKEEMVVKKVIDCESERGILQNLKKTYQEVLAEEDVGNMSLLDVRLKKTPQGLQANYIVKK